jgi:hypothetical protein
VSLRHDQLITVNKAVYEKERLEKGAGGGGKKNIVVFTQASTPHRELFNFLPLLITYKQYNTKQYKNTLNKNIVGLCSTRFHASS